MVDINANTKSELDTKLSQIDITVPAVGEGRTKDDREKWSICRFVAALNQHQKIGFSASLRKQERPDYHLSHADNNWGIEITEAVPNSYVWALDIAKKENPEAVIDISLFKYGEDKSKDEVREIVNASELTGDGWAGGGAARELAGAIKHVLEEKTEKLKTEGFDKYEVNVLLVYNNMPLSSLDMHSVIEQLKLELADYWSSDGAFDYLCIDLDETILCFGREGIVQDLAFH